jgi:putative ABC transport system ATP-binding protein
MIELTQVTKTFKMGASQFNAVDDVTLKIPDGSFIALMGPSGSGKSTLLYLIAGLDKLNAGKIFIDGTEIQNMSDGALSSFRNHSLGFVFQAFHLIASFTALENVMVPLRFQVMKGSERRKRATEVLKAVGLGERVNQKANELSGGERQRVAIARALVVQPKIILADEPTGNLDTKTGQEVVGLLKELNKQGITIVVVTHDSNVAKFAQKICHMKDGRLVA